MEGLRQGQSSTRKIEGTSGGLARWLHQILAVVFWGGKNKIKGKRKRKKIEDQINLDGLKFEPLGFIYGH